MKFNELAKLFLSLEEESSRNQMTQDLATLLRGLNKDEIKPVMYMITGRIVPSYIPLEFNMSTKLLIRGLVHVFKVGEDELKSEMAQLGDVGLVVEAMKLKMGNVVSNDLSIAQVFGRLYGLASVEGKGSQDQKIKLYADLVQLLDPLSLRYVSRIITGKLRLGLSHKTILDAISWSMVENKSMRALLDRAYGVRSDLGVIASYALSGDIASLEGLKIEPGVPVASKLVEREKSAEAAFARMDKCVVQPKYDGLRTQIHFSRNGLRSVVKRVETANMGFDLGDSLEKVRIFSRNMEPLTAMFPDIQEAIRQFPVDSIVLDAESIGYDPETRKFIPFQETIRRKRKYGVDTKSEQVPVKVFVFDVLYINGRDISGFPLRERLGLLEMLFGLDVSFGFESSELIGLKIGKVPDLEVMEMAKSELVGDEVELNSIFRNYLAQGLEGVIVKDIDSEYVPGTRTYDWIKLKANTYEDLVDSIDCVVLGYYFGSGARAKFGVGAFLVGVYNEVEQRFQTIAKVGSGVKDSEWKGFVKEVEKYRVEVLPKEVEIDKEMVPDVICEPRIVVVVAADEISKSQKHTAGRENGVGYSLRFPRFREWGRLDKNPEQITTVKEVVGMYRLQQDKA